MADSTKIYALNERDWTSVTQAHQSVSEAVQTVRAAQQVAYDNAQGNYGAARNSAQLANIEHVVGVRANGQFGIDGGALEPTTTV